MNDLEQVELNIVQAKHLIKLKKAKDALEKNKNWNILMDEEFFVQEASRAVLAKSNPSMQEVEAQKYLDGLIMSIGTMRQFLNKVNAMGVQAEKALADDEITRDELALVEV